VGENFINVTEGSGKKAHTYNRTVGANDVHDEATVPGEYPLPGFTASAAGVATTTAASHLMQLMATATGPLRVRRILVTQNAAAGAVGGLPLQIVRLTTAGTGGTVITPRPLGTGTAAATAMTLPTAKGTDTTAILWEESIWLGTAAIPGLKNWMLWEQLPNSEPIIIPTGTANGIAIKNTAGVATSTLNIVIEFVQALF
jgi:hypothetical protein